jgi:hypothetical protein
VLVRSRREKALSHARLLNKIELGISSAIVRSIANHQIWIPNSVSGRQMSGPSIGCNKTIPRSSYGGWSLEKYISSVLYASVGEASWAISANIQNACVP